MLILTEYQISFSSIQTNVIGFNRGLIDLQFFVDCMQNKKTAVFLHLFSESTNTEKYFLEEIEEIT